MNFKLSHFSFILSNVTSVKSQSSFFLIRKKIPLMPHFLKKINCSVNIRFRIDIYSLNVPVKIIFLEYRTINIRL